MMSLDDSKRNRKDSSSVELIREFDKGVMKIPRLFEGQIHDSCPEMPRVVDEKMERIDRFWKDEYLKTLNSVICFIQDWFTKISFKNKTAFMKKLIQIMADSKKLFDIAYFIGPPLKDSVYARTQFTRSPYDVAATDHNRSVEDNLYETQTSYYVEWFQTLNPQEQFNAFLGLAHLGGSALQECAYSEVVKILEEKEKKFIREKVLEYLATKHKDSFNVVASKVATRKKHGHRFMRRLSKEKRHSKVSIHEVAEEEEEEDKIALLKEKIEEFQKAVKNMRDIGNGEYIDPAKLEHKSTKGYHKSRRTSSITRRKKKNDHRNLNAGLDRIQMLPLWTNRQITALLPEKTRTSISNVNKYWREMVEKTRRELKIRKKIDKFLKPPESAKLKLRGGVGKDSRKMKNAGRKNKEISKKSVDSTFAPEDFHNHLEVEKVLAGRPSNWSPFSKPYNEFVVCNKFCDDRVFDATKRWAAYSCKMDVEFANIVSGASCNLRIDEAQKTKISCLCFHPEGAMVFTGGFDGIVKLHDVWKNAVKMTYPGHKGVVSDVTANCKYVASCGMDKLVRVFNISDGRNMFCNTLEKEPCRVLLTQCGDPILYIAYTSGELVMHKIRGEDSSKQIGRTVYAHQGEVTSIHHYPCVLLTTGTDGFARLWATNFEQPTWFVSLPHSCRVNSAVLSHRKIISACEDGKIRIWDVTKSACERFIVVVKNYRPVLDIVCINTPHTVKLVLNNEADIKVLEFPLRNFPKKKVGRAIRSLLKPVADLKSKMTSLEPPKRSLDRRMMKLQMRQAVLPPIRPSPHRKSQPNCLLEEDGSAKSQSSTEVMTGKTITKSINRKI
ncbi:hypothetical protein GE061_016647 [Apolygus lucorum]|uniref:WD repeat-containing protein 55 homolog n=1 Tax=Apolygus lucorum TaxID=248454 RepID=A0A8S9XKT2_APOLU|nr:hypothetical protein GE061_016647 [Apolygus lucorum]